MQFPSIALYVSPGHPATSTIRQGLRQALLELNLPLDWSEYYPGQLQLPVYLHSKESPLLVVNEQPFLFPSGTISIPWIKERIARETLPYSTTGKRLQRRRTRKMHLSLMLNIFIAFFPKCPLCWAAYLSLIGLAGAHSIAYRPWFLPLAMVLLVVNLVSLYFQGSGRTRKPFWLSLAGSFLVVVNRLYFTNMFLLIAGAAALLLASLWSALSRQMELTLRHHTYRLLGKLLAPANKIIS